MLLSDMPKPEPIQTLPRPEGWVDARIPLTEVVDDTEEEGNDDTTQEELANAVDLLRRASTCVAFFHTMNSQTEYLGEKGSEQLQNLVEELEDFLGEYST